ncbi:MAG: aldehyde ferredoxin oxidoreductase family protein, partial [Firmicutes bacterium]|nr:aldehyde ferredoxin oxidoreductase family protein [Bacillota bacterium]
MGNGFYGKVLEINLGTREEKETKISAENYRQYLGGSGLAAKIFAEREYYRIVPLSPEAPLLIFSGIMTGYNVPTACKAMFCGRSPATGIWAEAAVGGRWPAAFKSSGYDGLIITGKAEKPTYLFLDGKGVEFKDAEKLWGKDVYETQDIIQQELGDKVRVAAIGPAGENQVLISSIIIDGHDARAAGRCGLGALMGSKNLKAVAAVRTKNLPPLADAAALAKSRKAVIPKIREKAKGLTDFGTAGGVPVVEKLGDLPIKNWSKGSWPEGAAKISGQYMAETVFVKHYACFNCPIRCGKDVKVTVGPYQGTVAHGPEYETLAGFGSMCLNDNVYYIIAANDLCNRLGLDTISTSSVISFAMELFENNLLEDELLQGLDLSWGNGEAILALIQQIARKEKLGRYLGQGVKRAAAYFGPLAKEFAVESKGLEFAYHDPRAFTSMALVYATGARGACHLEGLSYFNENLSYPASLIGLEDEYDPHSSEGKPLLAKTMQDFMVIFNALGICKFLIRGHVVPEEIADWLSSITGWDI